MAKCSLNDTALRRLHRRFVELFRPSLFLYQEYSVQIKFDMIDQLLYGKEQ